MNKGNLFHPLPGAMPEEAIDILASGGGTRIERIVSHGHCSPPDFWYEQEEHEWVLLLKGAARLRFEEGNRLVELREGSYVHIRPHERHRVEATSAKEKTVWLAVFFSSD